jgi:hypothetical protein
LFPKEISGAIAEHLLTQNRHFKVPYQPEEHQEDPTDLRVQLEKILIELKLKDKLKKELGKTHGQIVAEHKR